jgi:AraC family transcriptional regulator
MRQNRSKDKLLETVSLLDELPDRAVFSSKSKGWNGIVTGYHHLANELVSPPLSQHLITPLLRNRNVSLHPLGM